VPAAPAFSDVAAASATGVVGDGADVLAIDCALAALVAVMIVTIAKRPARTIDGRLCLVIMVSGSVGTD